MKRKVYDEHDPDYKEALKSLGVEPRSIYYSPKKVKRLHKNRSSLRRLIVVLIPTLLFAGIIELAFRVTYVSFYEPKIGVGTDVLIAGSFLFTLLFSFGFVALVAVCIFFYKIGVWVAIGRWPHYVWTDIENALSKFTHC